MDTVTVQISEIVATIDTSYADAREIYASSGFTQITTRVTDKDQLPISDASVTFTELTSLGTLEPTSDSTDSDGYAFTEFSAGSDTGTAKIRIATGAASDTVSVRILPPNYFISASATPENPLADGVTQVRIDIEAEDDQLNPIENLELRVTSSNSSILSSRRVTTNASGEATVVVVAPASTTDIPLEVYVGLSSFSGAPPLTTVQTGFSKLPSAPKKFSTDAKKVRPPQTQNAKSIIRNIGSKKLEPGIQDNSRINSAKQTADSRSDTLQIVFSGVQLSIESNKDTLLANESDAAQITVTALRANGNPIGSDYSITVQSELGVFPNGQLSMTLLPNQFGRAVTTFTAGITPGEAPIFANIGEITSNLINIRLLGRAPALIELETDENDVIGTDNTAVTLTATVYDSTDSPLENSLVTFQSPGAGSIAQRSGATGSDGQFTTTYNPEILGTNDTTVTITAAASSNNNASTRSFIGPVKMDDNVGIKQRSGRVSLRNQGVRLSKNSPSGISRSASDIAALQASVDILVRGITLSTSTDVDELIADGVSEAEINVQAVETTRGFPVEGIEVTLQVLDNKGRIDRTVVTDESGSATATFTASINPGEAVIYAEIGGGAVINTSTSIQLRDDVPASITLSSPDQYLLADGNSTFEIRGTIIDLLDNPMANRNVVLRRLHGVATTDITVTLTDSMDNPMDGESVEFTTDPGTIQNGNTITTDGEATATLVAPVSTTDQTATVTVTHPSSGMTDNASITIRGIQMTLSASRTAIPANNTSQATITARLKEVTNNNYVAGKQISFSTDDGSIGSAATTDSIGRAQVRLTAGGAVNSNVQVQAQYRSSLTQTVNLEFTQPEPTYFNLTASPTEVYVQGASGTQNSTITAEITDTDSIPFQEDMTLTFTANRGYMTSTLNTTGNDTIEANFIIRFRYFKIQF
ncbi:MAG: hypothetical protein MAGBODY4_00282 [Candidatus Marinimicrobia bacterium]|nr:hypothetical protein [Candidatus Neomarinimicrobiota bacterium]